MKPSVKKVAFSLLAMPVLLLAIPFHLNAQDTPAGAWAGTWKFNPEKSKFPGNPPQADQVTIDPDGTISVQETSSTGKQSSWSYKPEQGKAVPVEGHGENVTVIATKVNPYKTTQVWNYNGRAGQELCHPFQGRQNPDLSYVRGQTRMVSPSPNWSFSKSNSPR